MLVLLSHKADNLFWQFFQLLPRGVTQNPSALFSLHFHLNLSPIPLLSNTYTWQYTDIMQHHNPENASVGAASPPPHTQHLCTSFQVHKISDPYIDQKCTISFVRICSAGLKICTHNYSIQLNTSIHPSVRFLSRKLCWVGF